MHSLIGFAQGDVRINDFAVDAVNNKIYLGGKFSYYLNEARNSLAAIDGTTGKILKWNPNFTSDKVIAAVAYEKNRIYVTGTSTNPNNGGYLEVLDSNGANVAHLSGIFNRLSSISSMTVKDNIIYISGDMEDMDDNLVRTLIFDQAVGIVATPYTLNQEEFKKILITDTKLCGLKNDKLYVYNKSTYALDTIFSFGQYGKASDFTVDHDTAFISGAFYWDHLPQGGIKMDLKKRSWIDWEFYYIDSTCYSSTNVTSGCGGAYPYGVSTIAINGSDIYVGGKIATKKVNNACLPAENPRRVGRIFSMIQELEFKRLFGDEDRRVRKYKVANNKLYYITTHEECVGALYIIGDNVAAYCLKPVKPGEFIKPVLSPCQGAQNVEYEIDDPDGYKKYVWTWNGKNGAVLKPNKNKLTISFPPDAVEGGIIVRTISDCGELSDPVGIAVNMVKAPKVYTSSEDKTITCSRQSIDIKGVSDQTPVSFLWTFPDGTKSNTESIHVTAPGIYKLTVTNGNLGCSASDNITVAIDTTKPIIKNGLNYSISSCNPYAVTVNGYSDDATDKIDWSGTNIPNTNPVTIKAVGNYRVEATRVKNGCKASALVTVTSSIVQPTIIPASTSKPDIDGSIIIDTLTCIKNAVALKFTSSSANARIRIKRPQPFNDTIPNNSMTSIAGYYTVFVQDTVTLCPGNPLIIQVKTDKTLPQLIMPKQVPTINCSFSTAVLNATSGTPGAILNWTGPGNFSSVNPASVNVPGKYILTITDPRNGCKQKDSMDVVKQNSLVLNKLSDTIVCKGNELSLITKPIGGTSPFSYLWNNNAGTGATVSVKPVVTTQYIVTVTDAANCTGKDTIIVTIPKSISDSTIAFAPCDPTSKNGEIQIFAKGGIQPYQYSIDNGTTYQLSSVFKKLAFGNYNLSIKDSLNCKHSFSKSITAQSQKPLADFIINTTMMQKDTFVVVDISNPRPDTIIWTFPASVKMINKNYFAPVIVSADTGSVNVTMEAHFGDCVNSLTKKVRFIKADSILTPEKGNGIEEIIIYPNPNNGDFTVEVKLFKKQTFGIYVFNAQGIEQTRVIIPSSNYSSNRIVLPVNIPGTYLLKVIAEYDSKSKTVVVAQ